MSLAAPISTIMTAGPETVTPDTPLSRVQEILFLAHAHHVPVALDRKLIGIVTSNDLLRMGPANRFAGMSKVESAFDRITAREAMTTNPITLGPHEPIRRAVEVLRLGSFNALPIVDDGELVGIVTTADLLGLLLERG